MSGFSPFLASSLNLTQILIVASPHQGSLCQPKWGQCEPTQCQDWWQSDQWESGTDIVTQDWWSGSLPRIINHLQQVTNHNIDYVLIHWLGTKGTFTELRGGGQLSNHCSLILLLLQTFLKCWPKYSMKL